MCVLNGSFRPDRARFFIVLPLDMSTSADDDDAKQRPSGDVAVKKVSSRTFARLLT